MLCPFLILTSERSEGQNILNAGDCEVCDGIAIVCPVASACAGVCMCVHVCVCTCVSTGVCIYYVCVWMRACAGVRVRVCVCVYVRVYVYIYIYYIIQGDSIKAGPILKRFYLSHFLLKLNKLGLKINIKHLLIDSKNN